MGSLHAHMEYDCYSRNVYVSLDNASEYGTYLEKLKGRPCIATFTLCHWITSSTIHCKSGNKEGLMSSEDKMVFD